MYRMFFEDPDNPEREEITDLIADCVDDLTNQGFDDKAVVECGLKYLLTLAYLMTTEESMDALIESIKTDALKLREQAMKINKRILN
jgi:predicted AlkP superfamily pyrophosphatase or phosphodiesterase